MPLLIINLEFRFSDGNIFFMKLYLRSETISLSLNLKNAFFDVHILYCMTDKEASNIFSFS